MTCRLCGSKASYLFLSLGPTPLANAFLEEKDLDRPEPRYPLDVFVCRKCFLVQLDEYETPAHIFGRYPYFSSYSDTWLSHVGRYADEMAGLLRLGPGSLVIEVGSNDGCLLRNFQEKAVPVLGIEPAKNVAAHAVDGGVPTLCAFFGSGLARELLREGKTADLLIANNVLAHVPNLHDFVEGLKILLKPDGVLTVEFPHLLSLVGQTQFDTIYHEHFSYFSLATAEWVLEAHGLSVYDLEELPTHGGSLRLYAVPRASARAKTASGRVREWRQREKKEALFDLRTYEDFRARVEKLKESIRFFLFARKSEGKRIAAYGAPAKGNTLLNFCDIGNNLIDYTVDRSVHKQGRWLPGSRVPIESPDQIRRTRPDYVLILPWNLEREITEEMGFIREWGGRFVVPVPRVRVLE